MTIGVRYLSGTLYSEQRALASIIPPNISRKGPKSIKLAGLNSSKSWKGGPLKIRGEHVQIPGYRALSTMSTVHRWKEKYYTADRASGYYVSVDEGNAVLVAIAEGIRESLVERFGDFGGRILGGIEVEAVSFGGVAVSINCMERGGFGGDAKYRKVPVVTVYVGEESVGVLGVGGSVLVGYIEYYDPGLVVKVGDVVWRGVNDYFKRD
jgi:hypothetical protein